MNDTIVQKASALGGALTEEDKKNISRVASCYKQTQPLFEKLNAAEENSPLFADLRNKVIEQYETMGRMMKDITKSEPHLHVHGFETPSDSHGEVSRLIAKLRWGGTGNDEFVYYIQRAYEILFNLAWGRAGMRRKNHLLFKTPVSGSVPNYAVHKIPDVDDLIKDTVMCVMLRGALLPSMILSKEMQEYSSQGVLTPFALFRIQRDDSKGIDDMEYILNPSMSYFNPEELDGRNLVFADPMNATGGSLVTTVNFLRARGIKPKSVIVLNVIAALPGALQVVRSIENADIYTLWMDPILNGEAYILPGLGDAGDRINGSDPDSPRNMIQLLADYGTNLISLYREQVRAVEQAVLR